MTLRIRQLHLSFAAEVEGLDLSTPLAETTIAELTEAIDQYGVLVFAEQTLDDAAQIAFASRFGPPERFVLTYRKDFAPRLSRPEMVDVSNLDPATGAPQGADARFRMINLGNRLWHTDSSFRAPCGALSMLFAHAVPPAGGETEFVDTVTAYYALPPATQAALDGLIAEHSLMHSRAMLGFDDFSAEERAALPAARHPVVRTCPRTGRKSLYLASHASHIVGMPVPEGRLMLLELIEAATRPDRIYRHAWRVGDLVLWDNRRTLHRGLAFDERFARDLRRVTTSDQAAA